MTVALTINGSTYNYPENQDENWGTVATQWATAVTNGMLQKAGGNFTLLADVNFGATYGLVSGYFKSRSSNISTTGVLRLANNEGVGFRNAANGADKIFKLDGSDKWAFGATALSEAELALLASVTGTLVTTDGTQTLTNKTISRSSNTLTNLAIVNADVDAAAAIALSKLATLTASRAVVSDGSGLLSASSVTTTELGLLSGVTGTLVTTAASQTLTNKTLTTPVIASFISNGVTFTNPTADGSSGQVIQTNGSGALSFASVITNPMTTKGDLISTSTGSNVTRTAVGDQGNVLVSDSGSTSGITWVSPQSAKNLIINGGFDFWQRGTSFTSAASGTYSADRFRYSKSGAMVHDLIQHSATYAYSGTSEPLYALRISLTTADTSIAAGDYCFVGYKMEGNDLRQIANRTFTLSFWVYAAITGTYCVAFRNASADRSYIAEYTINSANTWEKKTITVTHSATGSWNYDTSAGMEAAFILSCGSTFQTSANAWTAGNYLATSNQVNGTNTGASSFYISQVMLNAGSVAAPFSNYGGSVESDLIACQRYYEKSYNVDVAPGTNTTTGMNVITSRATGATTIDEFSIPFKVQKRGTPTITHYLSAGTAGSWQFNSGTSGAITAVRVGTTSFAQWLNGTASGLTAQNAITVYGHWTASAEL